MRLERHLAACPGCRATVAALRREGRLAVMPVVLAGGYEAGARGLVEHAAQATGGARRDRAPAGGAEASTGASSAVRLPPSSSRGASQRASSAPDAWWWPLATNQNRHAGTPRRRAGHGARHGRRRGAAVTRHCSGAGPRRRPPRAPARRAGGASPSARPRTSVAPPHARSGACARPGRRSAPLSSGPRRAQQRTQQAQQQTAQAAADHAGAAADHGRPQQNIADGPGRVERAASDVEQALERGVRTRPSPPGRSSGGRSGAEMDTPGCP